MNENDSHTSGCDTYIIALRDTQNVVNGKWKLAIVSSLLNGKLRFTDIQKIITAITPRMLSKELKELEINGVLTRTVIPTSPVVIEYELTESGHELKGVIEKMIEWGIDHRKRTIQS